MPFLRRPFHLRGARLADGFPCKIGGAGLLHAQDIYESLLDGPELPVLLPDGLRFLRGYFSGRLSCVEVGAPIVFGG